jgi:hypothetical protein
MANGISKKQMLGEQLRKKRAKAASVLAQGAKNPSPAIPIATKRSRPAVGRATAMSGPLPPAHYPAKRVAIGKRQVPGCGA